MTREDHILAIHALDVHEGDPYRAAAFLVNTRGTAFTDRLTGFVAREITAIKSQIDAQSEAAA